MKNDENQHSILNDGDPPRFPPSGQLPEEARGECVAPPVLVLSAKLVIITNMALVQDQSVLSKVGSTRFL